MGILKDVRYVGTKVSVWTEDNIELLRQVHLPVKVIASCVGVTVRAVYAKAFELGIGRYHNWTEYEDAWLAQAWPNLDIPVEAIAYALNVSVQAVRGRASKRKLKIARPWHGSPKHKEQFQRVTEEWNHSDENINQLKQAGKAWLDTPEGKEQLRKTGKANAGRLPVHNHGYGITSRSLKGHLTRSLWERWYADFLYLHEIDYEYEPKKVYLGVWEGKPLYYHPDFFLPSINCWVEVKGYEVPKDTERIRRFRKAGYRLIVMRRIVRVPIIRKQIAALRLTV